MPPLAVCRSPRRAAAALAAALAILASASLAPAAFAAPAYRGIQLHSMWSDTSTAGVQTELNAAQDLGANVIRLDVGWSSLETQGKGQLSQWAVDKLDSIINGADARGMKTIVTLMNTPCWASSAPDSVKQNCAGSWWDRGVTAYPPSNPQDYADMARWVTARYGTRLAALEVWNEPNPSQDFWKSSDPAGDYVKLVKATYPAAKAGNADVPVLAGALAAADVPFLQQLYADGMKGSYDGISVHPYNEWRDPSDLWQEQWKEYTFLPGMRWVHQTQVANGDNTPLWATEYGWSTCTGMRMCVSRDQQASYTAESTQLIANESYVKGYTIYDLRDEGTSSTTMNDNFGLVDHNYQPKPSYAALKSAWAGGAAPATTLSSPAPPANGGVQLAVTRQGGYYYATGTAPGGSQVQLSVQQCQPRCKTVKIGRTRRTVVRAGTSGRFSRRLGKVRRLAHSRMRVRARVLGRTTTVAARLA